MEPNNQYPNGYPYPQPPPNIPMKQCSKCGMMIGKKLKVCPYCGKKQKTGLDGCGCVTVVALLVIFIFIPSVVGISNVLNPSKKTTTSRNTSSVGSQVETKTQALTEATPAATNSDPVEELLQKRDRNGFDAETNSIVEVGGVCVPIPNYYEEDEESKPDDLSYSIKEGKRNVAGISVLKSDSDQTDDEFNKRKEKYVESMVEEMVKEGYTLLSSTETAIAGLPAQTAIIFDEATVFYLVSTHYKKQYINIIFSTSRNSEMNYVSDFQRILENISISDSVQESTAATEAPTVDAKKAVENGDYSLVTPSFKETMDSYEAFMDEYVAFMKKYKETDDVMGMLNDLTTMMQKEQEWINKINAIDTASLSPADDAYYVLVTLRVNQKLLSVTY